MDFVGFFNRNDVWKNHYKIMYSFYLMKVPFKLSFAESVVIKNSEYKRKVVH
ncbi:unnamed protein product [Lupinus luteus]|uniref:Uncharacterized protein n=1 Tax=Lupinus luteus TaxID=3873 RepID=A0AAV1YKD0_LUPLU